MVTPLYPWPPAPGSSAEAFAAWRRVRDRARREHGIESPAARARITSRRRALAEALLGYALIAGWVAALLWAAIAGGAP